MFPPKDYKYEFNADSAVIDEDNKFTKYEITSIKYPARLNNEDGTINEKDEINIQNNLLNYVGPPLVTKVEKQSDGSCKITMKMPPKAKP